MFSLPVTGRALGYQQLTATSSAANLVVPAGARMIYIAVSVAAIRWRDDLVAPTASAGMPVASGADLVYGSNLAAFQYIAESGSPVMDVSFYG
jgi:hypothetical protein